MLQKFQLFRQSGHETDFTICDFVSDLRAPTPSAAAELVYPSELELKQRISSLNSRLITASLNYINLRKQYLSSKAVTRLEKYLISDISKYRLLVDNFVKQLENKVGKTVADYRSQYNKYVALLDSFSPLKTMTRGYSVVTSSVTGKLISKVQDVVPRRRGEYQSYKWCNKGKC